jgi:deoxyuridine 5'-triphosphate nucleotidohydrolase
LPRVHFTKLDPQAKEPSNAYGDDAGWDLFALEDTEVYRHTPTDVRTGIAVAIPTGYYGRIVHRSSAPRKKNLMVLEGIIDAGFRGELFACAFAWLANYETMEETPLDQVPIVVKRGDSIAQLIIQQVEPVTWVEVDALTSSNRGEKGFGSSGN